ncbi:hypothetical protein T492DRAFT_1033319 [Pavlovales sp. CCMP2436]|nr:hypothetical protein T492DRAFT_1033319 [Pavlovales sp. CCMP2436]
MRALRLVRPGQPARPPLWVLQEEGGPCAQARREVDRRCAHCGLADISASARGRAHRRPSLGCAGNMARAKSVQTDGGHDAPAPCSQFKNGARDHPSTTLRSHSCRGWGRAKCGAHYPGSK